MSSPQAEPIQSKPLALTHKHYPQLDGLRGIAILLVMLYHFFLPYPGFKEPDNHPLMQIPQMGWMGVDLFFVLSGFLITSILLETKTQRHYFRNFLARRFLRIWPLYYLNLIALIIVLPLIAPGIAMEVQSMIDKQAWFWLYGANWLFAKEGGFGQTSGGYFWSLAVEEQFYLVWPLIVWWAGSRTLLGISALLLVSSLAARLILAANGANIGSFYTMLFTHWDGLAVGSLLAVCAENPKWMEKLRKVVPLIALAALAGLAAVRMGDPDLFFWSRNMTLYGYSLIAIVGGAVLVYAMHNATLARGLSTSFLISCGKYSYALYLIHPLAWGVAHPMAEHLFKVEPGNANYNLVYFGAAAATLIVSWVGALASWHLLEKHILSLKRHFAYEEKK